jgi:Ribonuclease HII/Metallo-beta-lactamase superfamily
VLDLGRPLDAEPDDHVPLPTIPGLEGSDDSLRGVVITHGHPDHYGLVGAIAPSVPMFIGEAAARVPREASFFSPTGIALQPDGFLADRRPFSAGPFELTPYLVDHSAFDAYALRVAAAGRIDLLARAAHELKVPPDYVLVDGVNRPPDLRFPSEPIVRGDASSASIAAASIIAKATRDRVMEELHATYPQCGFDRNRGYWSPAHMDALGRCGLTPVHRLNKGTKRWLGVPPLHRP